MVPERKESKEICTLHKHTPKKINTAHYSFIVSFLFLKHVTLLPEYYLGNHTNNRKPLQCSLKSQNDKKIKLQFFYWLFAIVVPAKIYVWKSLPHIPSKHIWQCTLKQRVITKFPQKTLATGYKTFFCTFQPIHTYPCCQWAERGIMPLDFILSQLQTSITQTFSPFLRIKGPVRFNWL